MSNSIFTLKNGVSLTLESQPFAEGGEGKLFKITSPSSLIKYVAKIYHPHKRTPEKEKKIEFLISNPPSFDSAQSHKSIIWINSIVLENNKFAGFIMPFADGITLEKLCLPKLPPKYSADWKKFDPLTNEGLNNRLKLCFNIAAAVNQIHKTGQYVIVDLKPENIKVRPNGMISILDFDSIEIKVNDKVLFPATVVTPEYAPPEYHLKYISKDNCKDETWDRFSLAVIFYKVLFGIHPFVGTCKHPYDNLASVDEMIKYGLFANNPKVQKYFFIIPAPHLNFSKIKPDVQKLFLRCFDDGHSDPNVRPSAEDWCYILSPDSAFSVNRVLPSNIIRIKDLNPTTSAKRTNNLPPYPAVNLVPRNKTANFARFDKNTSLKVLFYLSSLLFIAFLFISELYIKNLIENENYSYFSIPLLTLIYLSPNLFFFVRSFIRHPLTKKKKLLNNELKKIIKNKEQSHKNFLSAKSILDKIIQENSEVLCSYNSIIEQILSSEKHFINQLNLKANEKIKEKDKSVLDLIAAERLELKTYYDNIIPKIIHIKSEIRSNFDKYVAPKKMSYENRILEIDKKLNQCSLKEINLSESLSKSFSSKTQELQNEIQKIDNLIANADSTLRENLKSYDSEKKSLLDQRDKALKDALEKYQSDFIKNHFGQVLISNHAHSIFHDKYADPPLLARILAKNGFVSAADIIDYDASNGHLKRSDGLWIKVPQIASYRAKCLYDWSIKMKKFVPSIPQVLPSSISSSIESEYKSKIDALDVKYYEMLKVNKSKYINELTSKKQSITKELDKITIEFNQNRNKLLQEINEERNKLLKERDKLTKEMNNIVSLIEKDFRQNNISLIQQEENLEKEWENKKQEINKNYDIKYNDIINSLKLSLSEIEKSYDDRIKQTQDLISKNFANIKPKLSKLTDSYVDNLKIYKTCLAEYEDLLKTEDSMLYELNYLQRINFMNFIKQNIF